MCIIKSVVTARMLLTRLLFVSHAVLYQAFKDPQAIELRIIGLHIPLCWRIIWAPNQSEW